MALWGPMRRPMVHQTTLAEWDRLPLDADRSTSTLTWWGEMSRSLDTESRCLCLHQRELPDQTRLPV